MPLVVNMLFFVVIGSFVAIVAICLLRPKGSGFPDAGERAKRFHDENKRDS